MKDVRNQIHLLCGCAPYFPRPIPFLGDVLICSVHGETQRVDVEWCFKCEHCRYARSVGNSPMTVEVKATAHAIKNHHRVRVWKKVGDKIFDDFLVPPLGSQLVIGLDVPPF
jgi:hypothetical protein